MLNEGNYAMGQRPDRFSGGRRRAPGHPHSGHEGARGGPLRRDGRRQRRGDVRAAVLVVLEEKPGNGYQLIQELTARSNDTWRPSPGSIYPVLQQLEDEGLVAANTEGTGRTYALTELGRQYVVEQREQLGRPWENTDGGYKASARDLMLTGRQVMLAARQVLVAGSETQVAKATSILVEARRALYGLLAEGDDA